MIGYDADIVPTCKSSPVVGLSANVLSAIGALGRPDGIGTYTLELERALGAAGVTVRRVGAPTRVGAKLVPAAHATLNFPLPLPYLAAAGSVLHVATPLAGAVEREIDLYHATDYVVPRLARTPVVATIYDAIPHARPEWANPRLRRAKNWLLRNWVHAADLVIAISESAVPELIEHYRIPPARIRVVPLAVEARWFTPADPTAVGAILTSRGLSPGYFLHVGTLQPRKNLDALISAYERLPATVQLQRQLVLAGKYGWGAARLRERLERLRGAGRVVWVDYVEREELEALYSGADIFVFPSLAEGFGLPVLEAFAKGLRVIASDLPALREVADRHAEFVSPNCIDALSDAMRRMHDTVDAPAAVLGRVNRARSFDWTRVAARTIEIYRELV